MIAFERRLHVEANGSYEKEKNVSDFFWLLERGKRDLGGVGGEGGNLLTLTWQGTCR